MEENMIDPEEKDRTFSLRLPDKLLNNYRKFCKENSINISNRLRKFMEKDLENWKRKRAAVVPKPSEVKD